MTKIILTSLLLCIVHFSFSQGCSDAGLCSLPSNQSNDSIKKNWKYSLAIAPVYSLGEHFTSIISPVTDFRFSFKNLFFSVRIPYLFIFGDVTQTNGFGDISFIAGTNSNVNDFQLSMNLGLKIPSGKSNLKNLNNSLPMVYQTGLGTTDIIGGLSLTNESWHFAIAAQIPVKNNNNNGYLSDYYQENNTLYDFYNSNKLKRSGDLMLRIDKLYPKTGINLKTGFIVLYHIDNDKYTDINNREVYYENSKGFTINFNFGFQQKITEKLKIDYTIGFPVYARENRPDGLTRTIVFIPNFIYKF